MARLCVFFKLGTGATGFANFRCCEVEEQGGEGFIHVIKCRNEEMGQKQQSRVCIYNRDAGGSGILPLLEMSHFSPP